MLQELAADNLAQLVQENDIVLVQYSAGWCGNCKLMKPKFKRFSEENPSIAFVIADAEQFPESRKMAKVDNLPTFAAFKNGILVNQVQTNRAENLKSFIDEVTTN